MTVGFDVSVKGHNERQERGLLDVKKVPRSIDGAASAIQHVIR